MIKKRLLQIAGIVIVLAVLFIGSIYVFVLFNGRAIFLSEIEKNFGVKAEASSLRVGFPASIIISDFKMGDTIKAKKVIIAPSILSLIRGNFILDSLVLENPAFKITRQADRSLDLGLPLIKKEKRAAVTAALEEKEPVRRQARQRFYCAKLVIKDANIEFLDKNISAQEPFGGMLTGFNCDVSRISLLQPSRMQFKGSGKLAVAGNASVGSLDISGWIDLLARDMDAHLILTDLQMTYFKPYYKKFLKRDLKSGDMSLSSDLKSKNNDLVADCHLELSHLAFKEELDTTSEGAEKPKAVDLTIMAFDSILSTEGKAGFDFSIHTKMDKPRLGHIKMKSAFLNSPRIKAILSGGSQGQVQDFKQIGDQFKAFGKEFKKALKAKKEDNSSL